MSEFIYSISPKDRLEFETRYRAEQAALWAPVRGYAWIRAIFAIAFCALLAAIIQPPEKALAALAIAFFFFFAFQAVNEKITTKYFLRYLESIPDIEQYRTYIDGEYLTTEASGYRMGFPLSSASDIFIEADYLYIDFFKKGRVRIPLSAFPSEDIRREFEKMIRDKIALAQRMGQSH